MVHALRGGNAAWDKVRIKSPMFGSRMRENRMCGSRMCGSTWPI